MSPLQRKFPFQLKGLLLFGAACWIGAAAAADPGVPAGQPVRVSLEIDADGAGFVRVAPRPETDGDAEIDGQPDELASFPEATVTNFGANRLRIAQPMTTASGVGSLFTVLPEQTPRESSGGLMYRSRRVAQFTNASQIVVFYMKPRIRLPLKAEVDLARCDLPRYAINLMGRDRSRLQCEIDTAAGVVRVSAVRRDGRPVIQNLATAALREESDLVFDLPDGFPTEALMLELSAASFEPNAPPGLVIVDRVAVESRLAPLFGVAFSRQGPPVKIERVAEGGLGKRLGLQPGDLLLAIHGEPIRSTPDAVEKLGELAYGSNATLTIRRAGAERIVSGAID